MIMVLLFVVLLLVFAVITTPNKSILEMLSGRSPVLRIPNLINILNAMAVTAFLTQGVSMLMISGRLDLSTGANGTLCGMLLAAVLRDGMPLVPALLITLAVGAFIGLINAALVNELKMAPFIATLATSSIVMGFVYLIANKKSITIGNPVLTEFGKHMLFGYLPVSALVSFFFMIIMGIILHKTKFGRQVYLVGGNPQASMLAGINPRRMSYILFIICGLFSSMAGITLVSRLQSASMDGVSAQRFMGITAAVLGGISFGGGSGGMAGAFVGLLVLNTFNNGMTVVGFSPYWRTVASGMLLVLALMLDFLQKKRSEKTIA